MQSRPFTKDDAKATMAVFQAAVRITGRQSYDEDAIEAWLDMAAESPFWENQLEDSLVCEVLEDEDGVYAFASVTGTGLIKHLFCHPRRARQGAATHLLGRIDDVTRAKGIKELTCQASLIALPLFQRAGFEITDERWIDGMTCYGMRKVLLR